MLEGLCSEESYRWLCLTRRCCREPLLQLLEGRSRQERADGLIRRAAKMHAMTGEKRVPSVSQMAGCTRGLCTSLNRAVDRQSLRSQRKITMRGRPCRV